MEGCACVCECVYKKNHHRSLYVNLLYHTVYNFAVEIKIILKKKVLLTVMSSCVTLLWRFPIRTRKPCKGLIVSPDTAS